MAERLRAMNLAQRWSLGIGIFFAVMGAIGFAVNSDFATGSRATSDFWLVDWNGWHALSTWLVAVPLLVGAFVRKLAVPLALYVAFSLTFTGVWSIFDSSPYGLFKFEKPATDIVVHLLNAALLFAPALIQLRRDRAAPAAPAAPA